ncbi:phage tail tape measure protein [Pseudomonas sp.]|uniref:phage tail tape measure protein n=1 Tax=Pseudomonas sp. TaxID=306 RepID=UPI003FD84179
MARSLGTLTLDLIAKIGGFTGPMDKAGESAKKSMGQIENSAKSASQSVTNSLKTIGVAAVGYLGTQQIVQYAETWTSVQNRLKQVTGTQQELAVATQAVFDVAQRSTSALEPTAELYQRIASSTKVLGVSQTEAIRVTESISKAMSASGVSAESASAALVQLGQAFASGVLRGEELNSVMEQAPALANAIAAGMGVTVGELRTLGAAGTLTSKAVFNAILGQTEAIDAAFAKAQTTIAHAFTTVQNSVTRTVGTMDQLTGVSVEAAGALVSISKSLDTANIEKIVSVLGVGLVGALGRVAAGFANTAIAAGMNVLAMGEVAAANAVATAAAVRKAEVDLVTAKNAVTNARLNLALATSVNDIAIAERLLDAAKAKALAASAALSGARGAEATAATLAASATTAYGFALRAASAAGAGLVRAGSGLLALLGGPVGLAFIAGAVALSFVDFSSKSDKLKGDLSSLGTAVDQVRLEFNKLNADQQQNQVNVWRDKQLGATMAVDNAYADLKTSVQSGLVDISNIEMVDLAKVADQVRSYDAFIGKLDEAKANGEALGPILREAASSGQISPAQLKSWETQASVVADADVILRQVNDRLALQSDILARNTAEANANNIAKAGFTGAGQKYLDTLTKQLGSLQDNGDAVKEANRYIAEHADLSETDRVAIVSTATAVKSQVTANKLLISSQRESNKEISAAAAAAQKLLTAFENSAEGYEREIELINTTTDKRKKASEVSQLAFEIESGKLVGINAEQQERLKGLAAELDIKKQLKQTNEDAAKVAAFAAAQDIAYQTQKNGFDLELAGAGMGDKVRDRLKQDLAIRQQYAQDIKDLQEQQNSGAISDDVYAKETDLLSENLDKRMELQEKYYERQDQAQNDWLDGVSEAWTNYADTASDYAQIVNDQVSSQLDTLQGSFGDAISAMILENQSLGDSFRNIVDSMVTSLVKGLADMIAQWLIHQAIKLVIGGVGDTAAIASAGITGTAIATAYAPAAAAASLASFGGNSVPAIAGILATNAVAKGAALSGMAHDGIDSVPQDGTWLLQKGERVTTAQTSAKLDKTLAGIESSGGQGNSGRQSVVNQTINVQGRVDRRTSTQLNNDAARKQRIAQARLG